MKLLIIGHSVVDTVITMKGKEIKPGGIYYSVLGLVNFIEESDEIYICTEMSKTDEHLYTDIYDKIQHNYISYKDKIPQVILKLYDDKEREERYCNMSKNLSLPKYDLNSYDGILINMISGFDINLDQLRSIRKGYRGVVYFDVHTMARGLSKDMTRKFRTIPDFKAWAVNIDILQCNEGEFKTLSTQTSKIDVVRELFSYGIEIIIITKGEDGVRVFFENQERVESVFISSLKLNSINHVGCGDVFGAVFFYNYIRNKDIPEALKIANAAAGIFTTYLKAEEYKNLKNDVLQRLS